jgi:putative ABC transport system permease protein
MVIPILKERTCSASDTAGAPTVVLLSERLANRFWPDGDVLGRRIELPQVNGTATVIGLVAGTRQNSLRQEPSWQMYACYSQMPGTFATIVARTSGEPMTLARAVQEVVWSVDGEQAVWKIRTVDDLIRLQTADYHVVAFFTASFAAIALALALIGIHGVVSYAVSRRTREVGIRIALGAGRGSIVRLLLGGVVTYVAAGIAAGAFGVLALTRTLANFLYQITPTDIFTLFGCALMLTGTAALAGYLSTRKAMRTDPVAALRYE